MKTYNRETDGTTYYFKNGLLYGAPTNTDGSFDEENEIAVSEYAEPLTNEEVADIEANLK